LGSRALGDFVPLIIVIAGLDPAIHELHFQKKDVDAATSAGMTT
jgi:hypothetical protein